jgi:hypothetical protein
MQNVFEKFNDKVSESELGILDEIKKIALITSILIILLTVFFIYYIASAFTKPLIQFKHSNKKYVNSDFTFFPMNPTKSSNYEIETLKGSFILKKR